MSVSKIREDSVNSDRFGILNADIVFNKTCYYDANGALVAKDDMAVAYSKTVDKNQFFYLKCNTDGRLFNITDKSYGTKSMLDARKRGGDMFEWKKVTRLGFDDYLIYLKTKDTRKLKVAQRELM